VVSRAPCCLEPPRLPKTARPPARPARLPAVGARCLFRRARLSPVLSPVKPPEGEGGRIAPRGIRFPGPLPVPAWEIWARLRTGWSPRPPASGAGPPVPGAPCPNLGGPDASPPWGPARPKTTDSCFPWPRGGPFFFRPLRWAPPPRPSGPLTGDNAGPPPWLCACGLPPGGPCLAGTAPCPRPR